MELDPILLSIPMFFLLIGIELLVERMQHLKIYRLADTTTSLSCGIGDQVLSVFSKTAMIALYGFVYHYCHIWTISPSIYSYIALFFLYDLCFYWAHRWHHTVNLFWGAHVVHHSSEDFNFATALRQSWTEEFMTPFIYWTLAVVGFSTEQFLFVSAINLVYQFWVHTEIIGRLGVLEYVMNTPSHHRVHHGRNPQYIDKNYAGMFIIWDRLFRTFEEEKEDVVYGVTKTPESWNPLWIHLTHFKDMGIQVIQTPNFVNKLRTIFYKPGWQPEGYLPIPEVNRKTFQKFETSLPPALKNYTLLQYALILLGGGAFLFAADNLNYTWRIVFALLIIFSITNIGELFILKKNAYYLEFLRLFLCTILLVAFIGVNLYTAIVGLLFWAISCVLLMRVKG
jgi:alkylglycerol monooxygenase